MYNLTAIVSVAKELGVTIYLVPTKNEQAKCKQGIHLLMPSENELLDALNTAERDLFTSIYIHNQF